MRVFVTLIVLALASVALACDPPKKDDNGCNSSSSSGSSASSNSNASSNSTSNSVAHGGAGGTGVGIGVGIGGSATGGIGVGGNAVASLGPVNATNSIQGVQGGSATVNVTAGQPGASGTVVDCGDSVYMPNPWRPNAILTPWCPQPIPAEAVQPVVPADPQEGDYPPPRFWYGGKWYVIQ